MTRIDRPCALITHVGAKEDVYIVLMAITCKTAFSHRPCISSSSSASSWRVWPPHSGARRRPRTSASRPRRPTVTTAAAPARSRTCSPVILPAGAARTASAAACGGRATTRRPQRAPTAARREFPGSSVLAVLIDAARTMHRSVNAWGLGSSVQERSRNRFHVYTVDYGQ
jgi:hypothetical protein